MLGALLIRLLLLNILFIFPNPLFTCIQLIIKYIYLHKLTLFYFFLFEFPFALLYFRFSILGKFSILISALFDIVISIIFKYMSGNSNSWVHMGPISWYARYLMINIVIRKMHVFWCDYWVDSKWSSNLSKTWFAYRLGVTSRGPMWKPGCLVGPLSFCRILKSHFYFPSAMRLSKLPLCFSYFCLVS